MVSKSYSALLFSTIFASWAVGSQAFRLPGRRDVQLARRDLADHVENTIFIVDDSGSGLFILVEVEETSVPVQLDLAR